MKKIRRKIFKLTVLFVLVWTAIFNTALPLFVYAQEAEVVSEEVLQEEVVEEDSAVIETGDASASSLSETEANIAVTDVVSQEGIGETAGEEVEITQTEIQPELTMETEPEENVSLKVISDQDAVVKSTSTASANTGENAIVEENGTGISVIETGDASAVSTTVNIVNVNMVESESFLYLDTVMGEETRNINLYELYEMIAGTGNLPSDTTIITNQNAVVDSSSDSQANSGENQITSGEGTIETGNSAAIANSINLANLNLVGNTGGYFVINIVGSLLGDIIIPNLNGGYANPVSLNVITNQTANVDSSSQSIANTGENGINGQGNINTGSAVAVSNTVSYVNLVKIGGSWVWLIINNYGSWDGSLVNWENPGESGDIGYGTSLLEKEAEGVAQTLPQNLTVISNQNADITSSTTAKSNTGNNNINGNGNISTGDAYSMANDFSLANFVGVGGNFLFGFINILGSWFGDLNVAYPDLAISITDNKESGVAGAFGQYTITVVNQGNAKAKDINTSFAGSSDFIVSDPLNVNKYIEELNAGQTYSYEIQGNISSVALANTEIVSSVSVLTSSEEEDLGNNTASDTTLVVLPAAEVKDERTPDLNIDVWNNVNEFVYPGDTVIAKISVANQSPFTARDVKIEGVLSNDHPMPAIPMLWDLGNIKPGEKVVIEFSVGLIPELPEGTYHISANAKGKGESGNESSSGWAYSDFFVKLKYYADMITPEVLAEEDFVNTQENGKTNFLLDNKKYLPYILVTSFILLLVIKRLRKKLQNEN